jgi:transposase InsO family protein
MARALQVKGISGNEHSTSEYVIATIRIPGTEFKTSKAVEAVITRELHIVDGLDANILIGTDVMVPEKINLLMGDKKMQISSCTVTADIQVHIRSSYQRHEHPVHAKQTTWIPPRSVASVPIHSLNAVADRDFLFEPVQLEQLSLFAHVVDAKTASILVKNDTSRSILLPRNQRLGHLHELGTEQGLSATAFTATDFDIASMAETLPRRSNRPGWFVKTITALTAAYSAVSALPSLSPAPAADASAILAVPPATLALAPAIQAPTPSGPELVLPNGVTIYGTPESDTVRKLSAVVDAFPDLWKDSGTFVDLPQDEWMKIPLRTDWESRLPAKGARVYPLGLEARKVVDDTFDELHQLGRMSWTIKGTPFSFPVFVVWKTLANGERKGRVVVDVRSLNQMALPDVYPIPLQSDIIAAVQGCPYITVVDCASFFYQWRVHPDDRHKLTVVSHRGQESFNVAVMGFKNSPSYVQRQIERLLRPFPFAKAYIDDVVISSKTLDEHVQHLRAIFSMFSSVGISIKPSKAFLGYPSVRLLGQHVDSLGLATAEEKLEAISRLQFPKTLKDLETYLGLTGWLRQYVPFYAAVAAPLQERKTLLLSKGPTAGTQRKNFSATTNIDEPTKREIDSFETLQSLLSKPTYLVHFSPSRRLYIDLDSSKAFGIGAVVYHVKDDDEASPQPLDGYPKRTDIEPVMFLSRMLSPAETRYWPTELEVAGLVWVLRKTRHLIESSKLPVRVYTDHGASLSISKQTTLETTSAERSNLRLVRASEYIQRFNLEIRHKPGKTHLVPDALSRLASTMPAAKEPELDFAAAYNYTATLAEMSEDFRAQLLTGYATDPAYRRILDVLDQNDAVADSNKADLPFSRDDKGLIWHHNDISRLCIPDSLVGEILRIAHTEAGHPGFARTFERASSSWYIQKLGRHVRDFLRHCPECLVYQTRRHAPYGSLQPIPAPPVPFHTITIDFILALPETQQGFNAVMSVTDKFSKRITLILGKDTWSAADWASALLERLWLADWGLPKVIISDRDKKFLSAFWSALFEKLGVRLLYSTAYHPQTDGQSERTNQTVEIALRFYIATLETPTDWPQCLGRLQAGHNNSTSATGRSPNDVVYGFTPNFAVDLASAPEISPLEARVEASDALDFAAMNMKFHYDRKHTAMFLASGDWALLRLHRGYSIPSVHNRKLDQQYAGPFKVLEKVGRLAYKLKIPDHWRIHNVFSIAQLEPAPPPGSDPYSRPVPDHPGAVIPGTNIYEVERLLDKRVIRKGRGYSTQYLLRYKGYGPEHDEWCRVQDLQDCSDLIDEYEQRIK